MPNTVDRHLLDAQLQRLGLDLKPLGLAQPLVSRRRPIECRSVSIERGKFVVAMRATSAEGAAAEYLQTKGAEAA